MEEIVCQSTHGIDLHTGAVHRTNLPQIRANLDDEETERLARAFNVPVIISSNLRDGSLREAAAEHGIPMLLYEAGEALRFDEMAIRAGVKGIVNVMRSLGMLPPSRGTRKSYKEPVVARSSSWVRASDSGILRALIPLGGRVSKGTLLGVVSDPFGEKKHKSPPPIAELLLAKPTSLSSTKVMRFTTLLVLVTLKRLKLKLMSSKKIYLMNLIDKHRIAG